MLHFKSTALAFLAWLLMGPPHLFAQIEEEENTADSAPSYDQNCQDGPAFPEERSTPLRNRPKERVEIDQGITDVSNDIVNNEFFSKPELLYSFLKTVYEELENALIRYRQEKKLESEAIFLIFKGGNFLRMIANRAIALLPLEASSLLNFHYIEHFKRSDSDFSVFINEKKLNKLGFQEVYDDVAALLFTELNLIRQKLTADPKKSFGLFALEPKEASDKLKKYYASLNRLAVTSDADNSRWYRAKFDQLQILDIRANEEGPKCPYIGGYDYKYYIKDGQQIAAPRSEIPHWIINSDRRDIEIPWAIDPKKKYKFALLRSEVGFDYSYSQLGKSLRRVVGGSLIDLVVVHQGDDGLKSFLASSDNNVAAYQLSSKSLKEGFEIKSYSLSYLSADLRAILFETFDRPWKSGEKYQKRLQRLFFLMTLEMLTNYGVGAPEIGQYADFINDKIIALMGNAKDKLRTIDKNLGLLNKDWPKLKENNAFYRELAQVVLAMNASGVKKDEEEHKALEELLEKIKKSLKIAKDISELPKATLDLEDINKLDVSDLF